MFSCLFDTQHMKQLTQNWHPAASVHRDMILYLLYIKWHNNYNANGNGNDNDYNNYKCIIDMDT